MLGQLCWLVLLLQFLPNVSTKDLSTCSTICFASCFPSLSPYCLAKFILAKYLEFLDNILELLEQKMCLGFFGLLAENVFGGFVPECAAKCWAALWPNVWPNLLANDFFAFCLTMFAGHMFTLFLTKMIDMFAYKKLKLVFCSYHFCHCVVLHPWLFYVSPNLSLSKSSE